MSASEPSYVPLSPSGGVPVKAWIRGVPLEDAAREPRFDEIRARHRRVGRGNTANHLGTLGTGNHFIEVCLDEADRVWFLLHSGSRGVGNRIGTYFIERAREQLAGRGESLPDRD